MFVGPERLPNTTTYETVYRIDLRDLTIAPVFTSTRGVFGVQYSTTFGRVLVPGHVAGHGGGHNFGIDIIDVEGNLLDTVTDGFSAVFLNGPGTRIAVSKAVTDIDLNVSSKGTWIYDLETCGTEMIFAGGTSVEFLDAKDTIYMRDGGGTYRLYDLKRKQLSVAEIGYGGFSPNGEYRWGYKPDGVKIVLMETGEVVSSDFELLETQEHGTPLYWMTDNIVMVPKYKEENDFLLFVDSGKTLKAPGRILALTDDEEYVYLCKPGLVIEKVAMGDLEVLYEGKALIPSSEVETGNE